MSPTWEETEKAKWVQAISSFWGALQSQQDETEQARCATPKKEEANEQILKSNQLVSC